MYLTVIRLDPLKPGFTDFFTKPESIHKVIELSLNPDEDCSIPERTLWRSQWVRSEPQLIILSEFRPDPTIFRPYIGSLSDVNTQSYDGIKNFIKTGARFRFSLRANPIKFSPERKRYAITYPNEIRQWLTEKGLWSGFSVDEDAFRILARRSVKFVKSKNNHRVYFFEADMDGILTVTDPEAFERTLFNGIGPEKAYGCGLLMIQP